MTVVVGAIGVVCPTCDSGVGVSCKASTSTKKFSAGFHDERIALARRERIQQGASR